MTARRLRTSDVRGTGRIEWMDELRGLAIVLVILHHICTVPAVLGGTTPQWHTLMQGLEPFRMPLMLVLSGLLLPRSVAKPLPQYYWGKVRRVLWPFVLWTLITNAVLVDLGGLTNPWLWIGGSWHLWFLAVLLACYLVGPVTRRVPGWLWVIPMVALAQFPDTNAFVRILWFGSFFFFGAGFAQWVPRWQALRSFVPLVLVALTAAFIVWAASPMGEYQQGSPAAFAMSIVGVLAIVWVAPRAPRSPVLQSGGAQSMVYYLVHFPAIGVAYLLVGDIPWWGLFPLLVVAGYGVPFLFSFLRRSTLFELPDFRPRAPHDKRSAQQK